MTDQDGGVRELLLDQLGSLNYYLAQKHAVPLWASPAIDDMTIVELAQAVADTRRHLLHLTRLLGEYET